MPTRHYSLKGPFPEKPEPREPFAQEGLESDRRTLTVSEVTRQIKELFEQTFAYSVLVEGELSDPKLYPSGHLWFDLKDSQASLKCVMWKESVRALKFQPEQGLQVICSGRVEFYAPRGEVKFSVRSIEPKGVGALQLAFEQLKEKLQKEGLFADERKRPLPVFPERVGLVTSPQGAAIDDMLRILRGHVEVVLKPTRVQGEGAAPAIAQGIRDLNRLENLDMLIVGRGGGSLEDLWSFNEETVARAIAGSALPVISAVGHEKDWTISDLVADVRAPTPTKGAEIVLAQRRGCFDRLAAALEEQAFTEPAEWLAELTEKVENLVSNLLARSPQAFLLHQSERLHSLQGTLFARVLHLLEQSSDRVNGLAGRLNALSPLAVLERGYSITFDAEGRIIKRALQVKPGDRIETRLHEGKIHSRVERTDGGNYGD